MSKTISFKRLSRKLLSIISFYSGYCAIYGTLKLNHGVRILCFHGVSDNPTNPYAVSTSDFSKQMQYLSENYKIVSLDQLVQKIQNQEPLNFHMVAVSFDDGYEDFYTVAFPILRRYGISATVFLPTGSIDENSQGKQVLPQGEFLSWNQIREMQRNGIDFGSHTVSHTSLIKLPWDEIQRELLESKSRIEAEIGVTFPGFAYPYGTFRDIDVKIGKLIASSGYSWAVTSVSGVNKKGADVFALRRTVVEGDDGLSGFKRSLKGALDGWIVMQRLGYYIKGKPKHQSHGNAPI